MKKSYIFTFTLSIILIFIAFQFQERLSEFKAFGLLGIFLINLVSSATLFLPAPGIVSVVAGGVIYSPIAVAFVSGVGSSLGEMIGFLLGVSGKNIFIKNHHKWYLILKDLFKRFGDIVVFIFAFVPNPLFDVIGILAGAFAVPWYRFFLFLFIGRFLRNILLAYAGSAF